MPKAYGSSGGVRLTRAVIRQLIKKAEAGPSDDWLAREADRLRRTVRHCVHCDRQIPWDLKSDSCDACYDLDIVMEAENGPVPSHWMYLFNSQFIEHGAFSNE